jgi:hypothetical protein
LRPPARQAPRWSIPGVGELRPGFDKVRIVSSAKVSALKALLPIDDLKRASHEADVVTHPGKDPRLRSTVWFVGADSSSPCQFLAAREAVLASYRVVEAEIAFDAAAKSDDDARKKLFVLVGLLAKPRHFRKYLLMVHKPEQKPKPGYMAEPTFYFEDRRSRVALKCYCRYVKLQGGGFGAPCVRIEWTLKGKAAIDRHLGGNKIKDLLKADLNKFLKDNLRLEKVDHVALGKLLQGAKLGGKSPPDLPSFTSKNVTEQFEDPDFRSWRVAHIALRGLAAREEAKFGDWEQAVRTCQNSPAQIRGFLRRSQRIERLRSGRSLLTAKQRKGLRRRGRPKQGRRHRRAISDYRINACFSPIQLQPV